MKITLPVMDIQAQKAIIIEQFKQINDIDLLNTIKSILDYAMHKEKADPDTEIPESHKEIVRKRIKKYENTPESYLSWEDVENKMTGKK
jgi:Putative addiction module component